MNWTKFVARYAPLLGVAFLIGWGVATAFSHPSQAETLPEEAASSLSVRQGTSFDATSSLVPDAERFRKDQSIKVLGSIAGAARFFKGANDGAECILEKGATLKFLEDEDDRNPDIFIKADYGFWSSITNAPVCEPGVTLIQPSAFRSRHRLLEQSQEGLQDALR